MELRNNHPPDVESAHAWGADRLSRTLDVAHANARRTFAIDRQRCGALVEVDALYRLLLGHLEGNPELLAGALLLRTHSLYLGAVSMALSGMVAEAYALLNRSLKTGLQGAFVAAHLHRQQLWINRNNDAAARALMQDEFKSQNLRRHLGQIDSATLAICETLLRRTRDHSSHPNAYAVSSRNPTTDREAFTATQEYFVDDGEVQRYCLRSAAQVGICCLSIFFYVFPEEYRTAEIPDRLTLLRHGH
jgi:hypothetical protein